MGEAANPWTMRSRVFTNNASGPAGRIHNKLGVDLAAYLVGARLAITGNSGIRDQFEASLAGLM